MVVLRAILFAGFFYLSLLSNERAEAYSYTDTNIKAAYIVNLIAFVTFPSEIKQYDVCIIGDDLMGIAVANFQKNRGKLNLRILKKETNSNLEECHFVYLSNSRPDDVTRLLNVTADYPIVTISDVAKFARRGGMFEFVLINDKISININIKAATDSGLKLSPRLKQIAHQVLQ